MSVDVEPIDGGYAIVAKGQAVAFIEFGAGVYHNPSEPYPHLALTASLASGSMVRAKENNKHGVTTTTREN